MKAAFLIGGIYNLVPLVDIPSVNEPLKLTKQEAEQFSPLLQTLTATNSLKFFIVVAENESPAFKEQARELEEKLKKSGYMVQYIDIVNGDHFDVVEKLTEENFSLTKIVIAFNK